MEHISVELSSFNERAYYGEAPIYQISGVYKKKVKIISDKLHTYLMCYKIRGNLLKDPSILMNKLRGDTDCGCNEQILLFRIKEVGIR